MIEKSEKKDSRKSPPVTDATYIVKRGRGRPKGAKNKPKLSPTIQLEVATKARRGRPRGAKNKPKQKLGVILPVELKAKARRGRPKGAKNKPKNVPLQGCVAGFALKIKKKPRDRPVKEKAPPETTQPNNPLLQADDHPLVVAVRWLEKYMHPIELQHYRSKASRMAVSCRTAMVLDILSIFNIQDTELKKQVKQY